jgi:phage host-nuclease inhibitor protein Gam
MKKPKAPKLQPVLISSREGARAVVAELVEDKLRVEALTVQIEEAKAAIERDYKDEIDEINRRIQQNEGGLQVWSLQHPEEFGKAKSIDLTMARFGFRTCPTKVEKGKGAGTWEAVVNRLLSTVIKNDAGEVIFNGEDYIQYGDPAVAKARLIVDKDIIPAEALLLAGISFEQDEIFFFEPKSEVLEASKKEVA